MLSKLPECIIAHILSHWIEIGELITLDSALCSGISRNEFLDILTSAWFIFKPQAMLYRATMKWIELRNLSFESVELALLSSNRKPTIRYDDDWIRRFCLKMTMLQSFSCGSPFFVDNWLTNNTDNEWKRLVQNNPHLIHLEVCNVANPKLFCDFLSNSALNLETVHVWSKCNCDALYLHFTEPVLESLTMCKLVTLSHGNMFQGTTIKVAVEESQSLCITMCNINYKSFHDLNCDKAMLQNNKIVEFQAHYCEYDNMVSETLTSLNRIATDKGTLQGVDIEITSPTENESLLEIQNILHRNPNLLRLKIVNNNNMTDDDLLRLFANQNHKLMHININVWAVVRFSPETVKSIMHACPQLLVAHVNGYVLNRDNNEVNNDSITEIDGQD